VNNEELYDLKTDPGETKDVIAEHPKVVNKLRKIYDKWWIRMQQGLVNEDAYQPPANRKGTPRASDKGMTGPYEAKKLWQN
jgi:arylsulfatase